MWYLLLDYTVLFQKKKNLFLIRSMLSLTQQDSIKNDI